MVKPFLTVPSTLWGFAAEQREDLDRAKECYDISLKAHPDDMTALFGLARVAYTQKRWQDCVSFTERGFAIARGLQPRDPTVEVIFSDVTNPHVYYNYALNMIGRTKDALISCMAGLQWTGTPTEQVDMLQRNKETYEDQLAKERSAKDSDQQLPVSRSNVTPERTNKAKPNESVNTKCPGCGAWAYVGLITIECTNSKCSHFPTV